MLACNFIVVLFLVSVFASFGVSLEGTREDVAAIAPVLSGPVPPAFPDAYTASYVFTLPYVLTVQSKGLSFPVDIAYDGPGGRLAISVYGGLDRTVTTPDGMFLVFPRINESRCYEYGGGAGPTRNLLSAAPLPDLSSWRFGGTTDLGNARANIWTLAHKDREKVSSYTFYTSPSGAPLRLYMMGFNTLAGSHFDEYLLDFTAWREGPPSDRAFQVPSTCAPAPEAARRGDGAGAAAAAAAAGDASALGARACQAGALMPWARTPTGGGEGAGAGDALMGEAMVQRVAAAEHLQLLLSHDAAKAGYSLTANRFWGVPEAEFRSTSLGLRRSAARPARSSRTLGVLKPTLSKHKLPKHVDWRATVEDGVVKDQATCGSCWAFSAVGAMQGAWALATGSSVSLSEQALVDCSWEYGNNGCGGGWMEPAIQYVADAGGIPSEEEYDYRGQNTYCRVNASAGAPRPAARFAGFANVKARDEDALMEAVYKLGPVAISIDASLPSFRFYSDGVYTDPKCRHGPDYLDHAVLLVGYGTTDAGQDYWIVKNSWSKYWGRDGYILMARGSSHDCGITTDPVVAIVETSQVKDGRRYGPFELETPAT